MASNGLDMIKEDVWMETGNFDGKLQCKRRVMGEYNCCGKQARGE